MENFYRYVLGKNQFMKKRILVAVAILAGSVTFAQQKKVKEPPPPVADVKEVPPPPPSKPKAPPKIQVEHFSSPGNADYQAFLKRNSAVKGLGWSENKVRIRLKSGKEEVYELNNAGQMQELKNKYGELPVPPPPPKVSKSRTES